MAQVRDEDLFAGTSMSFGDHLEELRGALLRALVGLVIGTLIGLAIGPYVVGIIKFPLEKSLAKFYKDGSVLQYEKFLKEQEAAGLSAPYTAAEVEDLVENHQMVFTMYQVHPTAVRRSLGLEADSKKNDGTPAPQIAPKADDRPSRKEIKESEATKSLDEDQKAPPQKLEPLTPLFVWQPVANDDRATIKGLSAQEAFMIYLKASLMAGVIISSPWIFYQLWNFVAAGLYPTERRFVRIFLPISLALFFTGAAFCFFVIFRFVLDYLFGFNRSLGISPDPRINEWLGFAIFLPIGFGLSFQLPLVMLFLNRIGVMSVENYLAKWRISVLVIFVVAMVLTPADPVSMLAMAVPLTALYFGGIMICHWAGPKRTPLDA